MTQKVLDTYANHSNDALTSKQVWVAAQPKAAQHLQGPPHSLGQCSGQ